MSSAQLSPESAEEYVEYLRSVGRLDEAAVRLARLVNDERFVSKEGKSNYQVGTHGYCGVPVGAGGHCGVLGGSDGC